MKNEDQIKGYILSCLEGIDRIRANKEIRYPEIQIQEYKRVIAALYWVLDDPRYDVAGFYDE